ENWFRQTLVHDPNSVDGLRGLMNIYVFQKRPDKAIAAANAQIAASPQNSMLYDLLGALQLQRKDYAAAQAALSKAVELNKNNVDAYIKLAQAQAAAGAFDQAIATCNNGARDNPREAAFYGLIGSLYDSRHDLEKAKLAYQKALEVKHDDPLSANNLAYALLETNGNPDLALELAKSARRALPESSSVADTLGWAFYHKGVYQSAIDMFQEAIKLAAKNKEPDNPTYHYHLGMAYAKAEQPALARQHLERVLKIDPKYSDAA